MTIRQKKTMKKKTFKKMTKEEKKERIDYLWGRLRLHVKAARIVKTAKECVQDNFINEFVQNVEYTNINVAEHVIKEEITEVGYAWYLLR